MDTHILYIYSLSPRKTSYLLFRGHHVPVQNELDGWVDPATVLGLPK